MSESSEVEALFAKWLARRAAGDPSPIESLLAEFPAHGSALRRLHGLWQLMSGDTDATPAPHETFAERLRARFGEGVDPEISLDRDGTRPDPATSPKLDPSLYDDLRRRGPSSGRYHLDGEIAKGGMGAILKVYDRDLRRDLAMKVMLEDREKQLGRFLEEAQVTGQLDHPGIVPVHELGVDVNGKVFFTMKLVKGKDLREIFAMARNGVDGWNLTRAIDVLKRVCEAMAFAHEKHVLHRDLKPGNVMVGRHGEVYVMDWGLAKVLGRKETKDVRIAPDTPTLVSTERRDTGTATPTSALMTMDGDAIGTPSYMPIEQAEGNLDAIGPRSDIYAIGAMLYHLLAGRPPYIDADENPDGRTILARVLGGPPPPIRSLAKDAPIELIAICEKAMGRKAAQRYATMADLGDDLRAYLERRVVKAHRTGMFAETRMWVVRNPILATAFLLLVASLFGVVWQQRIAVKRERDAANQERAIAASERARAEERDRVLQLADVKELRDLQNRGKSILDDRASIFASEAAYHATIAGMERWIADAESLAMRLPNHESTLAGLEARGRASAKDGGWEFDSREDAWWHSALSELVTGFRSLSRIDAVSVSIPRMLERITECETMFANSIGEHRAAWTECIAAIGDPARCPQYGGLLIDPQVGLQPIGQDPTSGFWEFWFTAVIGAKPQRGADGRLSFGDDVGLVFVLLPGGTFAMGAQKDDPSGRNYDPSANENEGPVNEVTLDPFFLSKYEMTQNQFLLAARITEWPRATSGSPLPVDSISFDDAIAVLRPLGLDLPTEAQWEYGARGGTETPWYTGTDPASVFAHEIVNDLTREFRPAQRIGSLPPNPFGLHDMLGNLSELCRDPWTGKGDYLLPVEPGTGERRVKGIGLRPARGGSCWVEPIYSRASLRNASESIARFIANGVRPSRAIRR